MQSSPGIADMKNPVSVGALRGLEINLEDDFMAKTTAASAALQDHDQAEPPENPLNADTWFVEQHPNASAELRRLGPMCEAIHAISQVLANNSVEEASYRDGSPGLTKPLGEYLTGGLFVALTILAGEAWSYAWSEASRQEEAAPKRGIETRAAA